jgi:uncharacterized membrane protein YjgN (DUF898 family)
MAFLVFILTWINQVVGSIKKNKKMKKKMNFTGSFGEYFVISLGLLVLSLVTLGVALPYWLFWSFKYFFTKMDIDGKKVVFTGNFGEYFLISLGLLVLSLATLGLAFPYWFYWSFKYFFSKLEVEV